MSRFRCISTPSHALPFSAPLHPLRLHANQYFRPGRSGPAALSGQLCACSPSVGPGTSPNGKSKPAANSSCPLLPQRPLHPTLFLDRHPPLLFPQRNFSLTGDLLSNLQSSRIGPSFCRPLPLVKGLLGTSVSISSLSRILGFFLLYSHALFPTGCFLVSASTWQNFPVGFCQGHVLLLHINLFQLCWLTSLYI